MEHDATRQSLLSRVRDPADHAAWELFSARYGDLIVRYCHGRGLQPADVEDVRQVVMMNLSTALRSFQYDPARGRFRDYLGRAVRHAISRHMARPKRGAVALDSSVLACIPADDEGRADARWEQEWIDHQYRQAMETIRRTFEPQSVDMFDRILAGEGIEQVAAHFGTTTQAVHKVKQRIRDRMKELIAIQVQEEDQPDG